MVTLAPNTTPHAADRYAADFNEDGVLDTADSAIFSANYNGGSWKKPGDTGYDPHVDLNGDGVFDSTDVGVISGNTPFSPFPYPALPSGWISDPTSTVGPDNSIGYAGYVFNPEREDYTVRFRVYSTKLGRWMTRDPIGYAGGISLYGYVENQPFSFVDPLGLKGGKGSPGYSIPWLFPYIPTTDDITMTNPKNDNFYVIGEATSTLDEMMHVLNDKNPGGTCYISAHCGREGAFELPPAGGGISDQVTIDTVKKLRDFKDGTYIPRNKHERNHLCQLQDLMDLLNEKCDKVVFAQCNTGGGDKGKELLDIFEDMYPDTEWWAPTGRYTDIPGFEYDSKHPTKYSPSWYRDLNDAWDETMDPKHGPHICFEENTLVSLGDGSLVRLGDVKAGDEVLAYAVDTGELVPVLVDSIVRATVDNVLRLQLGDEQFTVTSTHPVFVQRKGWVQAGNVKSGDFLLIKSGEFVKVVVENLSVSHEMESHYNVVTLSVGDPDTFVVGRVGLVVHNK